MCIHNPGPYDLLQEWKSSFTVLLAHSPFYWLIPRFIDSHWYEQPLEWSLVQKILEFFDECVKEGNTFWRTKAALEALVDQYRSSDDEDYRSNLCCGFRIRWNQIFGSVTFWYGSGSGGSGFYSWLNQFDCVGQWRHSYVLFLLKNKFFFKGF